MKAQALIGGATYGPDALKAIWKAFDDAWAQIQPAAIADALGSLAGVGQHDRERLWVCALAQARIVINE